MLWIPCNFSDYNFKKLFYSSVRKLATMFPPIWEGSNKIVFRLWGEKFLLPFHPLPSSLVLTVRRWAWFSVRVATWLIAKECFCDSAVAYTRLRLWQWWGPWGKGRMTAHGGASSTSGHLSCPCLQGKALPGWVSGVQHLGREGNICNKQGDQICDATIDKSLLSLQPHCLILLPHNSPQHRSPPGWWTSPYWKY